MHLVIEAALDRHSQGAVASVDVAKFYDSVVLLRSARWLHTKGLSKQWCAAMLRFQLLLLVELRVGSLALDIVSRSCGSLTGSRTAGAAARIPVECSAVSCATRLRRKGFHVGGLYLTLAILSITFLLRVLQ